MVKSELINKIAEEYDSLSVRDIELAVNQVIEKLCSSLEQGGRIEVRGFGSFCLHYRPPRRAHNPKTGEKVITEGKYTPHFKPGKDLREQVNNMNNPITGLNGKDEDEAE